MFSCPGNQYSMALCSCVTNRDELGTHSFRKKGSNYRSVIIPQVAMILYDKEYRTPLAFNSLHFVCGNFFSNTM